MNYGGAGHDGEYDVGDVVGEHGDIVHTGVGGYTGGQVRDSDHDGAEDFDGDGVDGFGDDDVGGGHVVDFDIDVAVVDLGGNPVDDFGGYVNVHSTGDGHVAGGVLAMVVVLVLVILGESVGDDNVVADMDHGVYARSFDGSVDTGVGDNGDDDDDCLGGEHVHHYGVDDVVGALGNCQVDDGGVGAGGIGEGVMILAMMMLL